jgi:hypothetical protein
MKHDRRLSTCLLCECSSVTRAFFTCVQYITFTPTFKSFVRDRHRFGTSFWDIFTGTLCQLLTTSRELPLLVVVCVTCRELPFGVCRPLAEDVHLY